MQELMFRGSEVKRSCRGEEEQVQRFGRRGGCAGDCAGAEVLQRISGHHAEFQQCWCRAGEEVQVQERFRGGVEVLRFSKGGAEVLRCSYRCRCNNICA